MTAPAGAQAPTVNQDRRDIAWCAGLLLALLAWDLSGWDLQIVRALAGPDGFSLRDHWVMNFVMHQGGRALGWLALAALVAQLWRPLPFARQLTLAERRLVAGDLPAVPVGDSAVQACQPDQLPLVVGRVRRHRALRFALALGHGRRWRRRMFSIRPRLSRVCVPLGLLRSARQASGGGKALALDCRHFGPDPWRGPDVARSALPQPHPMDGMDLPGRHRRLAPRLAALARLTRSVVGRHQNSDACA